MKVKTKQKQPSALCHSWIKVSVNALYELTRGGGVRFAGGEPTRTTDHDTRRRPGITIRDAGFVCLSMAKQRNATLSQKFNLSNELDHWEIAPQVSWSDVPFCI